MNAGRGMSLLKRGFGKKGTGIVWQNLVPWLIAIAFLAFAFILIVILRGEGGTLIDKIKDLFRFR